MLLHAHRTPSLRSRGASRTRGDINSLASSLIGPARLRSVAPTPLGLSDLSALTRSVAAQVRTGAHDVVLDPDGRWYRRLYADPYVDVWLISWVAEHATELHDHAGSLGALTVVSGVLDEQRWVPAGSVAALRRRRLRAGRGATFGLGHVHDVVNTEPVHAVSVHAYSPPLTAMSYYAVDDGGALRRTRSVLTDGGIGVTTVDELLSTARARLHRVGPQWAAELVEQGAILVDTRPQWQRDAEGTLPGALLIERNHLEWRLDPTSDARIPEATDHDVTWIVVCSEGYSSSLAAASLQDLGLHNATDLDGGFQAWKAAGLPVA